MVPLVVCCVTQTKVPLPRRSLFLPLGSITKIHNLSRRSRALLTMIKGIIRPRRVGFTHSESGAIFKFTPPGRLVRDRLVMAPWRVLVDFLLKLSNIRDIQ